jgi:hypothetical protein
MSKQDFISLFHTKRKENKNSWFTMFETIEGEAIALKAYGTWIQRLNIKASHSGPSDCKVKEVTAMKG